MKLLPDLFQYGLKRLDVDLSPKIVEYFHKSAHVRALEMMGQVDIHIDGGVHRLCAAGAVQHNDRVFDVFHPDLFDVDVPGIFLALNVNHKKSQVIGDGQLAYHPSPISSLFFYCLWPIAPRLSFHSLLVAVTHCRAIRFPHLHTQNLYLVVFCLFLHLQVNIAGDIFR